MTDRELQLALDACRPGSRDLSLPEFAALAERVTADEAVRREYEASQKFGAQVQCELRDIPVPAGLAERILAALPAAGASTPASAASELPVVNAAVSAALAELSVAANVNVRPADWSRRKIVALAAAACVALVAVPLVISGLSAPRLNSDEVLAGANDWFVKAWHEGDWNEDLDAAPLADYRVENAGLQADLSGWQRVATKLDRQALLVRLNVGAKGNAALAIMKAPHPIQGLAALPPWTPQVNSGGRTVGVWQQDGHVYMLMVEGNPQLYRRLLPDTTIADSKKPLIKFAG